MDPCFHSNVAYNCLKDGSCPGGYECCSHNKVKGTCVQNGTCNRKTGLCKSERKPKSKIVEEDFVRDFRTREGYNDAPGGNRLLIIILLIFIVSAGILGYLKFSHRR